MVQSEERICEDTGVIESNEGRREETHAEVDVLAVGYALSLQRELLEVKHLHTGLVRPCREHILPVSRRLDLVARLGEVKVLTTAPALALTPHAIHSYSQRTWMSRISPSPPVPPCPPRRFLVLPSFASNHAEAFLFDCPPPFTQ